MYSLLRRIVSQFTWLKNRNWEPARFPEMNRDWDFVHVPLLYRLHRAWDPFLFGFRGRAALATSDAKRALHYASKTNVPSDVLPQNFFFLTEFKALPDDKIGRDFHQDKLALYPENKFIHRPNGIPLAGQLAKINAYRACSGYNSYTLQTAYLYEAPLDQKRHCVFRRWLIRNYLDDYYVSEINASDILWITKTLRLSYQSYKPLPALPNLQRVGIMPKTYNEYFNAVYVAELECHPFEILIHVLALGFTNTSFLSYFREFVVSSDPLIALKLLANDPRKFDSVIPIRDGRHTFLCIPELLIHVLNHQDWLLRVTGEFDLKKGILILLNEIVAIGVNPPNYKLRDSFAISLRCDHGATGGALNHLKEYF